MSLNILLISDSMIKERTAIHGNIDPKLIYPDIKVAQDMYIHPVLGSALYNKILSDISAGTLAGNYKNLVDVFIVDALIYYTLMILPQTISYQFWNKGVIRKQGVDTELPSMSDLVDLSNNYKNRAEFYANRLRLYLKQNAAAMFPEYLNPGNGVDDMNPQNKSFTLPVYLGDDCGCGKSYEEKYQGNKPNCCD
ncbi:MAG: DUF6712 family protein [Pseudobacter sp.]|uniref:DUF6712 family protein n=1 Tax=Pseudobacter sp. TaxID=2045420 RepID=UPI003F807EBC